MTRFKTILIIFISLFFFESCAKPTVVNIVLPEDKDSTCSQLEASIKNAQEFRKKAIDETGSTPGNYARNMFFWPALMKTYINAQQAMIAATERSVHLVNLMQRKDCKNADKILKDVQFTFRVQTLSELSEAYKSLTEAYESGALTESEFKTQKKKVLGQ